MWAELAFWAGPNWIQKTQKMTFFTSWEVLIRPKSIHEMTNSAQRYYIQKVHEKCYLTPPYVFFISVVVLDLVPCEFSQSKSPIFVKIGVWWKIRSAQENNILWSKNFKFLKIIDFLTNPRPRNQNYIPEVFLSHWSWYFDSWFRLDKLPKSHFFSKKQYSENSIKQ